MNKDIKDKEQLKKDKIEVSTPKAGIDVVNIGRTSCDEIAEVDTLPHEDKEKKEEKKEEGRKKKLGRPTIRSDELALFICEEITSGKSLVKICKENNLQLSTIFKWLCEEKAFSDKYARAKEEQADTLADEIIDLSDQAADIDFTQANIASAMVQARRLQVDARKWVAAKLKPKKYGDRVFAEVELGYEDRLKKSLEGKKEGLIEKAKALLGAQK